jgi:hypothetical protein
MEDYGDEEKRRQVDKGEETGYPAALSREQPEKTNCVSVLPRIPRYAEYNVAPLTRIVSINRMKHLALVR